MLLTRDEFIERLMDGIAPTVAVCHTSAFRVGTNIVEFTEDHLQCVGDDATSVSFIYSEDSLWAAVLYLNEAILN